MLSTRPTSKIVSAADMLSLRARDAFEQMCKGRSIAYDTGTAVTPPPTQAPRPTLHSVTAYIVGDSCADLRTNVEEVSDAVGLELVRNTPMGCRDVHASRWCSESGGGCIDIRAFAAAGTMTELAKYDWNSEGTGGPRD